MLSGRLVLSTIAHFFTYFRLWIWTTLQLNPLCRITLLVILAVHTMWALAEVKKSHKMKRLFFLVWGSSFTPESQHFSMYLASGTVREVFELTEAFLREVVCLFISLVWLLWFWGSFALKWILRTWLLASSKEFFVNLSLRGSSVFLLFLLCQVLFVD